MSRRSFTSLMPVGCQSDASPVLVRVQSETAIPSTLTVFPPYRLQPTSAWGDYYGAASCNLSRLSFTSLEPVRRHSDASLVPARIQPVTAIPTTLTVHLPYRLRQTSTWGDYCGAGSSNLSRHSFTGLTPTWCQSDASPVPVLFQSETVSTPTSTTDSAGPLEVQLVAELHPRPPWRHNAYFPAISEPDFADTRWALPYDAADDQATGALVAISFRAILATND